jgi:hypothetical protein
MGEALKKRIVQATFESPAQEAILVALSVQQSFRIFRSQFHSLEVYDQNKDQALSHGVQIECAGRCTANPPRLRIRITQADRLSTVTQSGASWRGKPILYQANVAADDVLTITAAECNPTTAAAVCIRTVNPSRQSRRLPALVGLDAPVHAARRLLPPQQHRRQPRSCVVARIPRFTAPFESGDVITPDGVNDGAGLSDATWKSLQQAAVARGGGLWWTNVFNNNSGAPRTNAPWDRGVLRPLTNDPPLVTRAKSIITTRK